MAADLVETRRTDFGPLSIAWDERVLEPRPWTAKQSQWAAELLETAPPGRVLELCSGAGHIGLLAVHDNDRSLLCVDLDPVACSFARRNATSAGMRERVEVREQAVDEFAEDEVFAVVIADPPWVRSPEVGVFPQDPVLAIDGGPDGLGPARACIRVIGKHLHPDGSALLQVGNHEQVRLLADELPAGLRVAGTRDEAGRGVVVLLRWE